MSKNYSLVDSGQGFKLERFGSNLISRPASQAVWQYTLPKSEWKQADAKFTREPTNCWRGKERLPDSWTIEVSGVTFKLSTTDFGHLGIFPEQADQWKWIQKTIKEAKREIRVLNLFAYSGGSTLAAAKAGASVCHLDASKGMVDWARENAALNGLKDASIRWIVDDAKKFLSRELRRDRQYDAIILDPPTFGRGAKGEIFKIEEDINEILKTCRDLLSDNPLFVLFSCHTPGFSPIVLEHLLTQTMQGISGKIETGEMLLKGDEKVLSLPSGNYARWVNGA